MIVVDCIVLARAESFAGKNPVLPSTVGGLGMGVGFTLALLLIGSIRELIGNGTIFGLAVMGAAYEPMLLSLCVDLAALGYPVRDLCASSVTGNKGTLEFFLHLVLGDESPLLGDALKRRAVEAVDRALGLEPYKK